MLIPMLFPGKVVVFSILFRDGVLVAHKSEDNLLAKYKLRPFL